MTKARNTGFIGCKVTKFIFIAQIKWKTFSYMRIYFMIYIIMAAYFGKLQECKPMLKYFM